MDKEQRRGNRSLPTTGVRAGGLPPTSKGVVGQEKFVLMGLGKGGQQSQKGTLGQGAFTMRHPVAAPMGTRRQNFAAPAQVRVGGHRMGTPGAAPIRGHGFKVSKGPTGKPTIPGLKVSK